MNAPSPAIPELLLSELSDCLTGKTGIYFPRERWGELDRGIKAAARELGFEDAQTCARQFLSGFLTKTALEILISHFTVGETYFFREPKTFEIMESRVIPDLIRARRGKNQTLRVWSAGCATGEEPYSIAILLYKLIPDLKDWNISILATDISPRFLQKAAEGVYSEWSFRNVSSWLKEKYFKADKRDRYRVLPEIRRMVNFACLNLVEDVYPSLVNGTNAMDVIFCRNVLMYFRPQYAQRVIENLRHSLVEGGWLIVSPVETSHILFSAYTSVSLGGVTLYAKPRMFDRSMADFGHVLESVAPEVGGETPQSFIPAEPEPVIVPGATAIPPMPAEAEVEEPAALPPQADDHHEILALYHRGHYTEAGRRVAARLAAHPEDTHAMELLARIFANQGRLVEAAEWCEKAINGDRLNTGRHYLHAIIDQERGRISEAVVWLKRVIYLEPDFVLAHFALGNLAQMRGARGESRKHYANALALLDAFRQEDILPQSEGMTAGRLREIIKSTTFQKTAA